MWIPRPHEEIEKFMDARFLRKYPWERRWVRPLGDNEMWTVDVEVEPDRAIVFGKGPSIQTFLELKPEIEIGPLRVCINESVLLVPKPDFVFYLDVEVWKRIADGLPASCSPVSNIMERPRPWVHPAPRVFWNWANRDGSNAGVCLPRQGYATAPCLLTVLAGWGIKKFEMVGFDSYENPEWDKTTRKAYAGLVEELGVIQRPHGDFWRINRHIDEVIRERGLEVEWFHLRNQRA